MIGYKGWRIPEGNVVEVKGASGIVIWAVQSNDTVVLEVEKIVSDTYAGSTTYTAEEFILLDVYPKTNGTVSVTYGGLTKTITDTSGAEEPNAQQVFFGTFNGVSDSVKTPISGELTIEGDYYAFGQGAWALSSKIPAIQADEPCIKNIKNFGNITEIPDYAFVETPITNVKIPDTVRKIGLSSFSRCNSLREVTIGKGVVEIGIGAFNTTTEQGSLKTVKILCVTPPTMGGTTNDDVTTYANFGDISSEFFVLESIIVPKGCGNTYKTAIGWSTYSDYIVEES